MSETDRPLNARDFVPDFPMMSEEKAVELSDALDGILEMRYFPWDTPEETARKDAYWEAQRPPRVEFTEWAASVGFPVVVRWLHDAGGGRSVCAATPMGVMRVTGEPFEELGFSEDEAIQRLADAVGGKVHCWQGTPDGTTPDRYETLPLFTHTAKPAEAV